MVCSPELEADASIPWRCVLSIQCLKCLTARCRTPDLPSCFLKKGMLDSGMTAVAHLAPCPLALLLSHPGALTIKQSQAQLSQSQAVAGASMFEGLAEMLDRATSLSGYWFTIQSLLHSSMDLTLTRIIRGKKIAYSCAKVLRGCLPFFLKQDWLLVMEA